jgi:hypothetical protein
MNCRKARLEISRHDSPELQSHLKSCPECARLAEAQGLLDNAINKTRENPQMESTPFRILQARVAAKNETYKGGFMEVMRKQVSSHPKFSIGIAAFLAVVIFAVLVPMPYETTVGYEVKFSGPDKNSEQSIAELSKALDAIGYSQVAISTNQANSEINYTVSNLATLQAAKEVSVTVEAISKRIDEVSEQLSTEISPIIETTNASLLAQAHQKLVDIEVEGKGKTDEAIEAEIKAKLAADGVTNGKVDVKTDSIGNRNINISIDSLSDSLRNIEKIEIKTNANDSTLQKKMRDIEIRTRGNDTSNINIDIDKEAPNVDVDTKGKTDAQIQSEIKQKLSEQGHPNAKVRVKTDSKGQRKIQIEMQDSINK